MKHQKDCGINSNVGIPKIQKDESYCTCNFTPTVDSSVEESQISKLQVQFNLSSAYAFALYKMIQKDRQSLITRIKGEVEGLRNTDMPAKCRLHSEPRGMTANDYDCTDIHIGYQEALSDLLNRIDKIV